MRTVKEVSRLTGVSVRTLHHYDAIGLLKPTKVTRAGYRLYDDAALRRLHSILLFRELQFSLKEIKQMLDDPYFDPTEALTQQIKLLELQRKRTEELISLARKLQTGGAESMDFHAFDRSEIEQYKAEAREKWGSTEAYREYEARQAHGGHTDDAPQQMMDLFRELGSLRPMSPESKIVQEKIRGLQSFITDHYYTCSPEILSGLGQMYVQDERFRRSIDRAGGEGTAEFVCRAIEIFCSGE